MFPDWGYLMSMQTISCERKSLEVCLFLSLLTICKHAALFVRFTKFSCQRKTFKAKHKLLQVKWTSKKLQDTFLQRILKPELGLPTLHFFQFSDQLSLFHAYTRVSGSCFDSLSQKRCLHCILSHGGSGGRGVYDLFSPATFPKVHKIYENFKACPPTALVCALL